MKKIIIHLDRENEKPFYPRDVRNYVGSIVSKEFEDTFMWHERSTAPFIYSMPQRHSIAIQTYQNNMQDAIEHLCGKLIANPILKLNGASAKIKNVTLQDIDYSSFATGLYEYQTRTPMVIGTTPVQKIDFMELLSAGSDASYEMSQFIRQAIIETIEGQTRHWFGESVDLSDDLMIVLKDASKPFLLHYKDKRDYPAVMMNFVSNRRLPGYVGYKIGMGYGEIRHVSQAKINKIKVSGEQNV
jgi:hypothetical protein